MKHLFIPHRLALLVKKKGFDKPCIAEYVNGHLLNNKQECVEYEDTDSEWRTYTNSSTNWIRDTHRTVISAPFYQQVLDWLETKGIYIELIIDGWGENTSVNTPCYRAFIWQVGKPKPGPADDLGAGDRYAILNIAIEHALNLL